MVWRPSQGTNNVKGCFAPQAFALLEGFPHLISPASLLCCLQDSAQGSSAQVLLVPPDWRHSPLPAPIVLVWSDSCCISVLPTPWCEIFKGRSSLCPGPCVPNRVLAHGGHVINSCCAPASPVVRDVCALINQTSQSPLEVCKIITYFTDEDTEAIIIMM